MKKILSFILCMVLLLGILSTGALAYFVQLSSQNLIVNGQSISCEKYNIDGYNYFKLRDVAYLVMGTESQFGVSYDADANRVVVVPGMPYEPDGSELRFGLDKSHSAVPSSQSVWIGSSDATGLSIYNIGGNNYFKLRDLGTALNFRVGFDSASNTAYIYTPDYVGPLKGLDE